MVFRSSKTDLFQKDVTLTITTTTDNASALCLIQNLFKCFLISFDVFLIVNIKNDFNQDYITKQLQERICNLGYKKYYTSYFDKNSNVI